MSTSDKPRITGFLVVQGSVVVHKTTEFSEAMSIWSKLDSGAVYKKVVNDHDPATQHRRKRAK